MATPGVLTGCACSQPVVLSTSAEHLERALEPLARDPAGGSYYDRSST